MADPGNDGSSRADETAKLELPSFGRRRRRKREEAKPAAETAAQETTEQPTVEQPVEQPVTEAETTRPVTVLDPEPTPPSVLDPVREPAPQPVAPPVAEPEPEPVHADVSDGGARRLPRSAPVLPDVPPRLAALLTGLVVGLLGAALTYGSLRGCEAVRGTETCGGGPGLLLLVAIFAVMVLVGGALLAGLRVAEPRSTSFLAVGVLAVLLLVALLEELLSGWMFLVVPVLGALSYLLAHWVTNAFVEPRPDDGPAHDVR